VTRTRRIEEKEEKERRKEKRARKRFEKTVRVVEGRYVRRGECLGRPIQSGDDGARSVSPETKSTINNSHGL
jgi:hypothetical protein